MVRWLLTLLVVAAACGAPRPAPTQTPQPSGAAASPTFEPLTYMGTLQRRGKLRVGFREDTPPLASRAVGGKPVGFETEIARELARAIFAATDADSVIEWVPLASAARVPALDTDKVDVVLATIAITADRRLEIALSDPYLRGGQRFLVKKGDDSIRRAGDLDGKTVCMARGTPGIGILARANPGARMLTLDTIRPCLQALAQGAADAVSADETVLYGLALEDPATTIVGTPLTDEAYGVGVKAADRAGFVEFIDRQLAAMILDGRWAALFRTWIAPLTGEAKRSPDAR